MPVRFQYSVHKKLDLNVRGPLLRHRHGHLCYFRAAKKDPLSSEHDRAEAHGTTAQHRSKHSCDNLGFLIHMMCWARKAAVILYRELTRIDGALASLLLVCASRG